MRARPGAEGPKNASFRRTRRVSNSHKSELWAPHVGRAPRGGTGVRRRATAGPTSSRRARPSCKSRSLCAEARPLRGLDGDRLRAAGSVEVREVRVRTHDVETALSQRVVTHD